jgi:hypothetical protein
MRSTVQDVMTRDVVTVEARVEWAVDDTVARPSPAEPLPMR